MMVSTEESESGNNQSDASVGVGVDVGVGGVGVGEGQEWVSSSFPLSSVAFAVAVRNGTREPLRPAGPGGGARPLLGHVEPGFAPPSAVAPGGGAATVVFANGGKVTATGENVNFEK